MRKGKTRAGAALGVSLGIACLCGFLVYHTTGFIYAIADDIIMRDIASGAFTGTPDGHLIFVRYALGFLLSRLYLLNESVDWYGMFMAGALFLGLAAVLYRGLAREGGLMQKAIYMGIALGVFGMSLLPHAAQFEWTISAAALGAAALYLYGTLEVQKGEKGWVLDNILIWLLLLLTYCIRKSVFLMFLPGFGLSFLWKFIRKEEKGLKINIKETVLAVFVFLSIGIVNLIETYAYQGYEWEEFQRFHLARSEVYDYYGVPSYEENPLFFEELGLDEHDVRNLRHYALYLVEGLDSDMMRQIAEEAERQFLSATGRKTRIWEGFKLAMGQIAGREYFSVSLFSLLFLAGICFWDICRKKKNIFPILFLCIQGVLWLKLGIDGRLPQRVAFSMHLVMLSGLAGHFLLSLQEKEEKQPGLRFKSAIVCITLISLMGGIWQYAMSMSSNQMKLAMDESYQVFKQVCKQKTGNLYFIETFMAEPVGGAEVRTDENFALNNCLTLGDWYSMAPIDKERFQVLGIADVEETILMNPNAYLVVRDLDEPGFLNTYFSHKYPEIKLVCQETLEIKNRIYYLYQPEWRTI